MENHCRILSKRPYCSRISGEYDACNEALLAILVGGRWPKDVYGAAGEKKPRLSPTDRFAVKRMIQSHTQATSASPPAKGKRRGRAIIYGPTRV